MQRDPLFLPYFALAAVCFFWGTTYLGIRMALESFAPLQLVCIRYILSGSILLLTARARGMHIPKGRELRAACISGLLVLGIGNVLLCDEGAGVHAMRHLERACGNSAGVDFVDGGTLSFTLAGLIEASAGLIVFDAAEMNAVPGSVGFFEGVRMDEFLGSERKRSVHEVGLLDLMALAALGGRLPARRALIGIQPQRIDWGEEPSPAVAAAIPRACERASELLARWQA